MKTLSSALLAAYEGQSLVAIDYIVFAFPAETVGWWAALFEGAIPAYPGLVFNPAGTVIQITLPGSTLKSTAQAATVTVNGLSADVLAKIDGYPLRRAKVTIGTAFYATEDGAFVDHDVALKGYISRPAYREDGGFVRYEIEVESRARELDRATYRVRTDADQARRSPGDKFFTWVRKVASVKPTWGRPGGATLSQGAVPPPPAPFGGVARS